MVRQVLWVERLLELPSAGLILGLLPYSCLVCLRLCRRLSPRLCLQAAPAATAPAGCGVPDTPPNVCHEEDLRDHLRWHSLLTCEVLPQVTHLLIMLLFASNIGKPVCLNLQEMPRVHSPLALCQKVHGDAHEEVVVETDFDLSAPPDLSASESHRDPDCHQHRPCCRPLRRPC